MQDFNAPRGIQLFRSLARGACLCCAVAAVRNDSRVRLFGAEEHTGLNLPRVRLEFMRFLDHPLVAVLCLPLIALVLAGMAMCTPRSTGVPTSRPPQTGRVALSWAIFDEAKLSVTCASVGADRVAVVLESTDVARRRFDGAMPCARNHGATSEVPSGVYVARLLLVAPDGLTIAVADETSVAVEVGRDSDLGLVEFKIW